MKTFMWAIVLLITVGCKSQEFGVKRISPTLGVTRGGEKITIYGSGFDKQSSITVYFGDHRAEYTAVMGSNQLWVNSPSVDNPGKVDVRLVTDEGNQFVIKSGFEFVKKNEMAECVNIGRALNGNL